MLLALFIVPFIGAVISAFIPWGAVRRWIIPIVAITHIALALPMVLVPVEFDPISWIGIDPLARLVLGLISGVFLFTALYAPAYLAQRAERDNRIFCTTICMLQGTLTLAVIAQHLGLMWVALEASTLSAAPLIYFNRNQRSIEATWKYLLVGSVGIAIALMGTFFLAYAAIYAHADSSLLITSIGENADALSKPWLHAAIVLLFIGYGTKVGLAPMHTWKPDAYGEAPGMVGVILASALTSCAFLAIMRIHRIASLAGDIELCRQLLLALGLTSMAVASAFMVRQQDFKRLLAYSSVEHMGILAVGIGIGGNAVFGALFHLVANAFTKGVLFLAAGNIHRAYRAKHIGEVRGALVLVPFSGALFLTGFFAITGAPPFAPFFSELAILEAAVSNGRFVIAGCFLFFLLVVFVGMGATVLAVVQGEPPTGIVNGKSDERAGTILPIFGFLLVSLVLGLHLPESVHEILIQAAAYVEGK